MRKLIAGLVVWAVLLPIAPVHAQGPSFGAQIGTKLLTSVIGAMLGKGFESIFGNGPKPVTAEQLGNALRNSFQSAKLKDVKADIIDLRAKVRAYQKSGSIDSRRNQIDTITDLSDHIRATIQVHIHNGAFSSCCPTT